MPERRVTMRFTGKDSKRTMTVLPSEVEALVATGHWKEVKKGKPASNAAETPEEVSNNG